MSEVVFTLGLFGGLSRFSQSLLGLKHLGNREKNQTKRNEDKPESFPVRAHRRHDTGDLRTVEFVPGAESTWLSRATRRCAGRYSPHEIPGASGQEDHSGPKRPEETETCAVDYDSPCERDFPP